MKRLLLLLSLLSLSLVVHLSAQEQYKVTYSAGEGGAVEAAYYAKLTEVPFASGEMVPKDAQVYLTATPNEGYEVDEWLVNDKPMDYAKGNTLFGVRIDESKDIRVTFVSQGGPERFMVSFSASEGGTLSATYYDQDMVSNNLLSGTTLPGGSFIEFLATPRQGLQAAEVGGQR